jgi:hypothetical protein
MKYSFFSVATCASASKKFQGLSPNVSGLGTTGFLLSFIPVQMVFALYCRRENYRKWINTGVL